MSVRHIVRNTLLAAVVPGAAALALFAGPAQAQTSHNPPGDARPAPTAPAAALGVMHNPPTY